MYFKKLNELIKSKSQKTLSEEVGCSQSTISRFINNEQTPSGKLLLALSEVTKISANDILNEIHEKKIETEGSKKPRS